MSDDALYNRLKVLRAQRGLTQGELALAVGVSRKMGGGGRSQYPLNSGCFIPFDHSGVVIGAELDCPRVRAFFALDPSGPPKDSAENGG